MEVPVRVDAFNSSGFSTGGMLRVRSKDIKADPWIQPGANGSHSMVGVLANEAWVCLIDLSTMGVQVSGSDKRSILKGIDLNTGESRMTVLLPGTRTLCNDIAVGSNKAVYVTNSFRAANPFAAARFQPDGGLG